MQPLLRVFWRASACCAEANIQAMRDTLACFAAALRFWEGNVSLLAEPPEKAEPEVRALFLEIVGLMRLAGVPPLRCYSMLIELTAMSVSHVQKAIRQGLDDENSREMRRFARECCNDLLIGEDFEQLLGETAKGRLN
jgi:hypothetical protein